MKRTLLLLIGIVVLLVLGVSLRQQDVTPAAAQSGGSYDLEWFVMGSAGEQFAAGGNYQVGFTLAQTQEPLISTDGANYTIIGGFWHSYTSSPGGSIFYLPIIVKNF